MDALRRYFEGVPTLRPHETSAAEAYSWVTSPSVELPTHVAEAIGAYLSTAEVLGRRTGELHVALASGDDDSTFGSESYPRDDLQRAAATMRSHADEQLRLLELALATMDAKKQRLARELLDDGDELLHRLDALSDVHGEVTRIRCHGDYHLGQVLVTEGDVVILDFEGEPARPLEERRQKTSPLRDVAGMLRSFSYAALIGLETATQTRPEDVDRLAPWASLWETWVSAIFLRAYVTAVSNRGLLPSDWNDTDTVLRAFMVDKALYELGYELNNRPEWAHIPLTGLLQLRSLLHA
jgi:maltose alpha-D-glucosyltransferase/alpha-amylase